MSYEDKTTTTIDGRKATPEAQLELRRRCIVYFRDGVKRAEIARRLGLSRQWVTKIIKIYQTEGFDSAVAGKKRGLNEAAASEKRRLSREEEKKVANWIVDKNPAQLKFDFALWTAKAVRQLIYREFGRQLDLSNLRSWGMTPQRPKKKAIQQDDAAVQRWLETDYPAIAERAKKGKSHHFLGRRNRCPAGHQLDPRLRAARKDADDPS
ncbi:MAG: winged helix-turn-helix domain-containing protein [Sutterella seckii]